MHTTVNLGLIDSESIPEVGRIFGEFDQSDMNQLLGVRHRELFRLGDLLIHTQDFDQETNGDLGHLTLSDHRSRRLARQAAAMVLPLGPEKPYSPFDAHATRFYAWEGKPAATSAALFRTVIVGRMGEERIAEVRQIFDELDSTDVPGKMGTSSRQLYHYGDVYLHVQHFTRSGGEELIDQAWRDADPRFIKACKELMAIIPPYDPRTWTVPTDSLATCFYEWGEML
jgi:hypothetical protein